MSPFQRIIHLLLCIYPGQARCRRHGILFGLVEPDHGVGATVEEDVGCGPAHWAQNILTSSNILLLQNCSFHNNELE